MNSVRAAVLVASIALVPGGAQAQGALEAWVQRYNGPGNSDDEACAMVVDAGGNVYVTGWSYDDPLNGGNADWVTIAYSSGGVSLWTNRYNPGNASGSATAIALDASGNVLVTGYMYEADGLTHCTIIKYSSTGVPLWTNRAAQFSPIAMALDTDGSAFVTGTSGYGSGSDYVTAKYSGAGAILWTNRYNGPGNGMDTANALATDRDGNVVVTGFSTGAGLASEDYATIKYSSAGAVLWTQRYNGSGNKQDRANAVAVDSDDNVFVTGSSDGATNRINWDYTTIKYSSAGAPLWSNRYNGPGDGTDEAKAVAVDAGGNVVVTGSSEGPGGPTGYATVKYSSEGMPLWTNRGPAGGARGVALDAGGNVFVIGTSSDASGMYADYTTLACSSAGLPLWTNRYNGPGDRNDFPGAVAVDTSGSVYLAGSSEAAGSGGDPGMHNDDFATVKYVSPPFITRQPSSQTNAVGTTATFTVEVAGSAPFTYQWRRQGTNLLDGLNISGVTTTNLQIASVQQADAGGYTVVVTNAYGSVTSTVAQLTVTIPPSPGRFTRLSYSPDTGFSFIFRDATVGKPYRIQTSPSLAEGSWVDWESFTYTGPKGLMDVSATGAERRFYRANSP